MSDYGGFESPWKPSTCRDCRRKNVVWKQTPTGWKLLDVGPVLEDGSPAGDEHWKTCPAPAADRRRRRAGLVKEIVPMSVNRLEDFRKCPVLYQKKYVEKLKLPPTPAMFLGRGVHQFAAALALGLPEPTLKDLEVPPEIAHQWPMLERGIRETVARINPENLLGIEDRQTIRWKEGEATVEFEVVPDRTEMDEDLVTVVDYKTSWYWPSREDVKGSLQLQVYGLAYLKRYDWVQRVRGKLELVRYGARGVVDAYWTREELLAFEQALQREVRDVIQTVNFIPNPECEECLPEWHDRPDTRYRFTALQEHPEAAWEAAVVAPTNVHEAVQMARGVKMLDGVQRAARGALNAWTKFNGPLQVGKGGFGHFLEAEKTYKITEVIKVLEAANVPLQEVLKLDMTAAKKYLGGKKVVPGLSQLITESYKSGFRWAKDYQTEVETLEAVMKLADATLQKQLEASLDAQPFIPEVIEGGR